MIIAEGKEPVSPDSVWNELINLLCAYPPLKTRAGRDAWLMNLPDSVQDLIVNRHDSCKIAPASIVDAVKGM